MKTKLDPKPSVFMLRQVREAEKVQIRCSDSSLEGELVIPSLQINSQLISAENNSNKVIGPYI